MDAKGFELLMAAKILGDGGGGMAMDAKGFERLMAAKILGKGGGGKIEELEGVPPLTFTANGQPLLDYLISGNTKQTGTPTPKNPIIPSGCGEIETTGAHAGQYKLPLTSAGQDVDIYLGEVQTTRRIKKLVLTGEENWTKFVSSGAVTFYINVSDGTGINCLPTHFIVTKIPGGLPKYNSVLYNGNSNKNMLFRMGDDTTITDVESFKSYLAAQYAAGTPVTVWYVLEEPETAVVNEPLMKISNYADTVSMEQAGVNIPTNKGSTTLDVDTTIKPSNVYIKYKS